MERIPTVAVISISKIAAIVGTVRTNAVAVSDCGKFICAALQCIRQLVETRNNAFQRCLKASVLELILLSYHRRGLQVRRGGTRGHDS
jgi:hypothetical protein